MLEGRPQMVIVAIIKVRQDFADQFREYERRVAAIMQKHGGAIERTVVVPPDDNGDTFREIHLIRFCHRDGFMAYQTDPDRKGLESLRQTAIVETNFCVGEDGPDYHGANSI